MCHTISHNKYMIRILLLHILTCALLLSSCQPADVDTTEALPFSNDGKTWGLIATDGTVILPANSLQHRPSPIVGGMFSMSDSTGRIYLYDSRHPSSPVSQRSFVSIGHFFESVTPALEASEGPILLIDKQGNNVASTAQYPQYEIVLMHNFSNGLALFATASGKYGYMDTRGNIAIPPLYDRAYDFHEGLALVGNTNSQGQTGYLLIDTDGQASTAIGLSNSLLDTRIAGNRLLFYNISSRHLGFLNRKSDLQFYLPDHIDQASRYLYDMAVIRSKRQKGLIDLQGNILLPPVYENIHVAGPELIALKKDSLWGITELTDNPAIHFRYDSIGHYYGSGQAIARKQGRSFFINRQGEPAGETYAYILEDSTASRLCPQCFLIHMPAQTPTVEPAAQPLQTQANADMPSQQDRKEDNPTTNTSRIEQNDWKQISKQHPFYQEAIKVVSGKLEEKDAENRRMILNYVEHLRTSYTTKDIDFLEQLFSENALIIVGTVVHSSQKETGYLSPAQVLYNVRNKRQYLDKLKQVFNANRSIDVQFSNFRIMRHPTIKGIYGVSLRQQYRSDIYSDDGYLFLLWDFRDETAPQIHVRTWQPRMQTDQTPIPENEIFNINNFNLQ